MNQTCDRCGPTVRAAYRAARAGELYLCRRCANQLRAALSAQGWTLWPTRDIGEQNGVSNARVVAGDR